MSDAIIPSLFLLTLPVSSTTFILIKNIAAILGILASIVLSFGVIHAKVIGPWVAKPIANAVRHELAEAVEAIILGDIIQGHIKEITEELVTHETRQIMKELREHDIRLRRIEDNTTYVKDRMAERPPRGERPNLLEESRGDKDS